MHINTTSYIRKINKLTQKQNNTSTADLHTQLQPCVSSVLSISNRKIRHSMTWTMACFDG